MAGVGTILRAVRLIWQRGDQILPLLEVLPDTLNALGNGMEIAGEGAIAASQVIRGGGQAPVNAHQLVLNAAAAIEQCKNQIDLAAGKLDDAGEDIGDITIPTGVEVDPPPFGQLLPVVKLVNTSLFGGVETAIKTGANRLEDVGDELQNAANNLNSFAQALDDAGGDLNTLGTVLRDSGVALQQVTSG
jgi:hypothetical protein